MMPNLRETASDHAGDPPTDLIGRLPDPAHAALLLDFDGTLVELAPRPDAVVVPQGLGRLLDRLWQATEGGLALVSGRRLADLDGFVPGFPGLLIGSHGAEARAEGLPPLHPAAGSPGLERLKARMHEIASATPGTLVEDKPASVVLHYRQAPEAEAALADSVGTLARETPDFVLHRAKMAFEIHPHDVSKAAAVERLLATIWSRRIPVAAGDDLTDEGMFRVAAARGGIAVKIGEGESAASLRLPAPPDLGRLLSGWLDRHGRAS